MSLEEVFGRLPDPGAHAFPDVSLPKGDPVFPIALTREELSTALDLYEDFAAVDPTGLDSVPLLRSTTEYMRQSFGIPRYRPDDQLVDDVGSTLSAFGDDLGSRDIGVADATPEHLRTLYFFLTSCRAYHAAPHVHFDPDEDAVATVYDLYDRIANQDVYLKHPSRVFD